ncbi:hypothetical protein [Leptospira koniambonensis]|uniref:hypothetical protein n=1 Tax=Leptospira koniambonensis TaxID=2484950 RepID=UPI003EC14E0C
MEDYKIKEKIRKISDQLRRLTYSPNLAHRFVSDDNTMKWDAPGFVCKLLFVSSPGPRISNLDDLSTNFLADEFTIVRKFFEKGILRISFGILDGEVLGFYTEQLNLSSEEETVLLKIKEYHRSQFDLFVSASDLEEIHQAFVSIYSKTPPIEDLIRQQFLKKMGGRYAIQSLFQRSSGAERVYPSALARFWSLLREDETFSDDTVCFSYWFSRAICLEGWESITKYLSGTDLGLFIRYAWDSLNTDVSVNSGPLMNIRWGRKQLFKESSEKISSLYRYSRSREDYEFYSTYSDHSGKYRVARTLLQSILHRDRWLYSNEANKYAEEIRKFKIHPWLSLTIAKELPWNELPYLIDDEELGTFLFEKLKELDEAAIRSALSERLDDEELYEKIQSVTKIQISIWNLFLKIRSQPIFNHLGESVYKDSKTAELIAEILLSLISECLRLIESPGTRQFLLPLYRNRIDSLFLNLEQTKAESDEALFISKVLAPIVGEIDRHMKSRQRNEFRDFSIEHLFLLFRFLEFLVNDPGLSKQFENVEALILQIRELIVREYIFELTRVTNDTKGFIIWHNDSQGLLDFDWQLLISYNQESDSLFSEFVSPVDFVNRIREVKGELRDYANLGYYSIPESVRTWVYRIRLHLAVLAKLQLSILSVDTERTPYQTIVDSALHKLLVTHCRYELAFGRLNLFDAQLGDLSYLTVAVLERMPPDLALDSLRVLMKDLQSPTFLFSVSGNLKSNVMQSEMEKFLLRSWDYDTIKKYIERQYWFDPLLNVVKAMSSLADNDSIRERLERLIDYVDKERSTNFKSVARKDWVQLKFPLLLRIALFKNDQKTLEDQTLSDSEKRLFQNDELQRLFSVRKFYLGLFWMERNPKKAYYFFDELVKENHSWKLVAALNRFAAQIEIAENEENSKEQTAAYKHGLQEWRAALGANPIPEQLRNVVISNLLQSYSKLNLDIEFKTELNRLDPISQLSEQFLPILIDFDLKHKNTESAELRISQAASFHTQDGKIPEWLERLQEEVKKNSKIKLSVSYSDNEFQNSEAYLRSVIFEILKKPFSVFSQIVESDSSENYVLKRILQCLVELRNRRALIRPPQGVPGQIFHKEGETTLNDWLGAFLRQRLLDIGGNIEVDPPQGSSASSNAHPGKPDIIIRKSGNEIAVIECFWMENDPVGHAEKIHNYSSSNIRVLIAYCKTAEEFNWERYEKKVDGVGRGFLRFENVDPLEYHSEIFRIRKALHELSGAIIPVYHVLVLADFAVWSSN